MNSQLFRKQRCLVYAAGCLLLSTFSSGTARAQAFSAFDVNQVRLVSGFTFSVNGIPQSDLSNVGASGVYDFGFQLTGGPIVVQFLKAPNDFNIPFLGLDNITGIESFGLISNTGVAFTRPNPGNTIHDYDGSTNTAWKPQDFGGGGGYTAKNFGGADFLRGGSEFTTTDKAQYGSFEFDNVSGQGIFLGAHFRDGNNNTGHIVITEIGDPIPPASIVPESSGLALFAGGLLPILGFMKLRKRTRK
jgi:hypothetical protein